MKRTLLAGAGVVVALIGCRTLVGIDDLEFNPGPPQNDAGNTDAANDGATALIATCLTNQGGGCRSCCKGAFPRFAQAAEHGDRCLCRDSTCNHDCNVTVTVVDAGTDGGTAMVDGGCQLDVGQGGGQGSATGNACVQCEDHVLSAKTLDNDCQSICGNDLECQNGLSCVQQCPQ